MLTLIVQCRINIMLQIDDKDFNDIVATAATNVPEPYKSRLNDVAFLVRNKPSAAQRQSLGLSENSLLFGLYEGVPLTKRGGAVKVLPDKITIFKDPFLLVSASREDLIRRVNNTVWHEVAHYFGLDHKMIHRLENK